MYVMPDEYMSQSGVHPPVDVTTGLQFIPACSAFALFV